MGQHPTMLLCAFTLLFGVLGPVPIFGSSDNPGHIWRVNPIDYNSEGYILNGHPLGEPFRDTNLITQCARRCYLKNGCLSFNFNGDKHHCQLNSASHLKGVEPELDPTKETQYVDRNTYFLDQKGLGPCEEHPCEHGHCIEVTTTDRVHKALCICERGYMGRTCADKVSSFEWADWGPTTTCSVSCGNGWISRKRACKSKDTGQEVSSLNCYGPDIEEKACHPQECPMWDNWGEWGPCSTHNTCGPGIKTRSRECLHNGKPGKDRMCMGPVNETTPCVSPDCHAPIKLYQERQGEENLIGAGALELYDSTSQTWARVCASSLEDAKKTLLQSLVCKQLGYQDSAKPSGSAEPSIGPSPAGVRMSNPDCTDAVKNNNYNLYKCLHNGWNESKCQDNTYIQCIVHGMWSAWSSWGKCSVTCEEGIRMRNRQCNSPPALRGGNSCPGEAQQQKPCTEIACPVDGSWKQWSEWGSCSVPCGGGIQNRTRDCNLPLNSGDPCPGPPLDTQDCNMHACPIDGSFAEWSVWGACSFTCGKGTHERVRTCTNPQPQNGGMECVGIRQEKQECGAKSCPVDGLWASWEAWGPCDQPCNNGTSVRTRPCTNPAPMYGGIDCEGPADDSQVCFIKHCPIDGMWGTWHEWSECKGECGSGTKDRVRVCDNPAPQYSGANCEGDPEETAACFTKECPVDGSWSDWGEWDTCSATCGNGTNSRSRTCTDPAPQHSGKDCEGKAEEMQGCFINHCSVDGGWSQWSVWGKCSKSCGDGIQERTRACTAPAPQNGGEPCSGESIENQSCNVVPCPIPGEWKEWGDWRACSVTCGDGNQERSRDCQEPQHNGTPCDADGSSNTDTQPCNKGSCLVPGEWQAWEKWGDCSVTCNKGTRMRSKNCNMTTHGSLTSPCIGDNSETGDCNDFQCKPHAATCGELVNKGLANSDEVEISPGGGSVFTVWCEKEGGKGVTVLYTYHKLEERFHVKGFEGAGEFSLPLEYTSRKGDLDTVVPVDQVMALVDSSLTCSQHVKWECISSGINSQVSEGLMITFVKDRYDEQINYFADGDYNDLSSRGHATCTCGLAGDCAQKDVTCNCDINDDQWRFDEVTFNDKELLPLTSFNAGDTGQTGEQGFGHVGPLQCVGEKGDD